MGLTERLQVVATHNEPSNKHVIWLKDNTFRKWDGDGWVDIGGGNGTTDYKALKNKPLINGRVLEGNINLEIKGEKGDTGPKGEQGIQGIQGLNGKNGIGIAKVEQIVYSNEDSGENIVRVTLEDGTFTDITILNGSKGSSEESDVDDIQIINIELDEEYIKAYKEGSLNWDGVLRSPVPLMQLSTAVEAGKYTKVVANEKDVLLEGYSIALQDNGTSCVTLIEIDKVANTKFQTEKNLVIANLGNRTLLRMPLIYKLGINTKNNEVTRQDAETFLAIKDTLWNSINEGLYPYLRISRSYNINEGTLKGSYAYLVPSTSSDDINCLQFKTEDRSLYIEINDTTGIVESVKDYNMDPIMVYKAIDEAKNSVDNTIDVDLEMSDISNNAVANSIIKKYVDYADNTLSERIANLEQNGGGVSNAEPQIINIELSEEYVTAIKKGYLNHDGVIRNAVPIIQMETPLEAGRYTHVVANGTEVLAKGYTAETKVGNTYATAMVHVTEFLGERPDTTVLPLVLGSGSITAIQFLTPYKSNVRISGADVEQQDKDLLKNLFTIIPNSEGVTPVSVTRITEIQNGKNYAQVNLFYSNLSSDSSVVRIESRDGSLMIEFDETGTIQRVDNFNMMPKAVYDAMNDNDDYYTKNEVNDLVNEAVDYVLGQGGSNVEVDSELSDTSENAVSNKAVTMALAEMDEEISHIEGVLNATIIEDEEVTAAALNELNEQVNNASTKEELAAALISVDEKIQNAKDVIDTSIIDNEEVIAAALNDLNKKVNNVYTKDEINTNFTDVNNTLKSYVDSSIAAAITTALNTGV